MVDAGIINDGKRFLKPYYKTLTHVPTKLRL